MMHARALTYIRMYAQTNFVPEQKSTFCGFFCGQFKSNEITLCLFVFIKNTQKLKKYASLYRKKNSKCFSLVFV